MKDDDKDQRSGEGSASALERLKTLQRQTGQTRVLPKHALPDRPTTRVAPEAAPLDPSGTPENDAKLQHP